MVAKIFNRENTVLSRGLDREKAYYIYFMIIIAAKNFYFQYSIGAAQHLNGMHSLMTSFSVCLMIIGAFTLVFNGRRKEALFVFDLLISILFIADTLYYRFYESIITVPITQLMVYVGGVTKSVQGVCQIRDLVYIMDIPFMLWALIVIRKLKTGKKFELTERLLRSGGLILAGVIILVIFIPNRSVNPDDDNFDANKIIKSSNIMYFHYYDIKRYIITEFFHKRDIKPTDEQRIKSLFVEKRNERNLMSKKYRGIAKGKNLIIVQVESLQHFPINSSINGVEITPFLNKFIKENTYFDNFYYQVSGGNTSDAEFMTNVSLYPLKVTDGAVYVSHDKNKYYSLPQILKERGYNTAAYHGYLPKFWNRENMYKTLGFDKFKSMNDFQFTEKFGMGAPDDIFFKQSVEDFDTTKPFYSMLITLSSHNTFSNFEDYDFDVGQFTGTRFGNYVRACNYDDKCLEQFIQELKQRNLYDNSLIVIYGDHNGVITEDTDEFTEYLGLPEMTSLDWAKQQRVPLIIHLPGQKKGMTISHVGGDIDILPTIANLMDFDVPFAMGRDLLNVKYGYAAGVARTDSIVTDRFFYLRDENKLYDMTTNQELNTSWFKTEIDKYTNEENLSNMIIKKDYLETLQEEQEKGKKQ